MFYIVEKQQQLSQLKFEDCFVRFIPQNDNFHPTLSPLSLIYIRPLSDHKGYILCLSHTESFSLDMSVTLNWLNKNTGKLWVMDKKQAMYWFPYPDKLYDVNFIAIPNLTEALNIPAITYYYSKYINLPTVNKLIPISKHYEESERVFNVVLPIIQSYRADDVIYAFNNDNLTRVFHDIEKQGIKVDKQCFIDSYGDDLKYPEFNLYKGKIYSQYNLYTTTGRPSNTYNSINFAALNKNNGERLCYRPSNNKFIEFDIQGYHPRLIGELIDFHFPIDRNTYDYLGELLGVSQQEAKELTFKQLYGGVWSEYQDKPFFKDVAIYTDKLWDVFQFNGCVKTENKTFKRSELPDMTPAKLLNYVVQSAETATNVILLDGILRELRDKKTKLVLYTYDAFLFDYAKEDGTQLLTEIQDIIHYPVNVKQGNTYHGLNKI
jgi:hypothetical protein